MSGPQLVKSGKIAVAGLVVAALYQWAAAATAANSADDALFARASGDAMTRVMAAMSAPRSGNVDQDFVTLMIPHHQGAVDMAQAEIRFGKNEHLRRIAQEIIIEQQQQITAMRMALEQTK